MNKTVVITLLVGAFLGLVFAPQLRRIPGVASIPTV